MLAAAGPKRLHIVMLRDIDANRPGKLFTKGVEQNASSRGVHQGHPGHDPHG
ncbi:MAG: hypothetical protein IPG91_09085 [Ideonella sp.]|nr:hypothetical protein [Ideonella sp.]